MSQLKQATRGGFRALVAVVAASLAVSAVGCRSVGEPTRPRADVEPRHTPATWDDSVALRPVAFEEGAAGAQQQMATTSAVIDGTLRITKRMPQQVRAGNVFQYELTVENITDLMLGDVVIREHDAGGMDSPGQIGLGPPAWREATMLQDENGFYADAGAAQPVRQELPRRDLDDDILAPIPGQAGPVDQPPGMREPPMGDMQDQEMTQPPLDGPQMLEVGQQQPRQQRGPGFQEIYIGTLGPRESRTVTVTGSVPTAGEFVVCTSAAYTPMVCAVGFAIQPELSLSKIGPEFAGIGETIQYELTVRNTGIGPAHNVRITDPLPGPMRTAQGQAEVTFDVGTLASGQSRTFTVTAVAPEAGRYTNIARVVGADGLWDEAQAVTIIRAPRLQVQKRGPEIDYADVGVTFEIAVTNVGDAPAQNVVLEDLLPVGARVVDATEGARMTEGRVAWDFGTLAPEETRTVLVRLAGGQIGPMENCVIARADRVEPVRDCWTVLLEGVTGLLLELVDTNDPIRVGETEIYAIRVTNQGTAPATDVAIDVQIDERMELVSTEGATPSARTAYGLTFDALPALGPGASVEWRVVTRGIGPGDTRFRVALRAAELERPVIAGEATRVFE